MRNSVGFVVLFHLQEGWDLEQRFFWDYCYPPITSVSIIFLAIGLGCIKELFKSERKFGWFYWLTLFGVYQFFVMNSVFIPDGAMKWQMVCAAIDIVICVTLYIKYWLSIRIIRKSKRYSFVRRISNPWEYTVYHKFRFHQLDSFWRGVEEFVYYPKKYCKRHLRKVLKRVQRRSPRTENIHNTTSHIGILERRVQ